ncbi:DUF3775 domain-containing protein [Paralimibaculum aggregatum]|uniref:DUF3775 domain-containing protein n=1 Tax=Paralimibaculum aggregatum TaxID=3036245 RepID=A0ABQ6LGJ6_9RHOB|nr:DUF3775 domain-containing protein [Limibaculum sp. NKW23]GMG81335.1 DUF3775 domain-containing protein [Limibaculum sp. NKW23]
MLTIPLETIGWIIVKARELDVKDVDTAGAEAEEDDAMGVLEDRGNDPSAEELTNWIQDLNLDQQAELVAVFWIGREGAGADELADYVAEAQARRAGPTARYLLGSPLLADHLEAGLETLGINVNDLESRL